jgi:hypothetical protein
MAAQTEYPAAPITVKGVELEVFTDADGAWLTRFNGTTYSAASRAELAAGVARTLPKLTKVAVPFVALIGSGNDQQGRRGTAYGLHSGTGHILVTWDDGSKGSLSSLVTTARTTLDADADPAEWGRLHAAYVEAAQAMYRYQVAHQFDLHRAVSDAIREALTGGEQA